jgi:ORF6N domain
MLDSDLAELYRIETFNLNKAVNRNLDRFPEDFMFQIAEEEAESLTSQIAISKPGRGGRRYLPYAFTEHGVAMLSCDAGCLSCMGPVGEIGERGKEAASRILAELLTAPPLV